MTSSWHSLLVRIGDRCAEYGGHVDAEDHIETCCGSLVRDIDEFGEEILALLMQCVEELPHKDPLYGTLVGLLNLENSEFVAKVVTQTHDGLQAALDAGNCNKIRTLMRFLTALKLVFKNLAKFWEALPICTSNESKSIFAQGDMVQPLVYNELAELLSGFKLHVMMTLEVSSNVIGPGSLIEVFETLVSSAATTIDEDGGNPSWQPRADFYVFCILASFPWAGLELAERVPDDLERVLAGVEAYLTLRKRCAESSLSVFNVAGDQTEQAAEQEDFLEDLWSIIQGLMESGWKIESVPRPHLAFESRLVTGPSHQFLPLSCPDAPKLPAQPSDIVMCKHRQEAELLYPRRIGRLRIFPASMTDEKIAPVDRFVVEEYLLDILFYLNGCRKECAAYMVGLPVSFRYEYLMAEIVFSQLLLLPSPPFRLIYYTVVMVDLCKALPGAFPAVVAGAVRILFERVGDMDSECRTRLVQWFSHHLSNFQFVWPWGEWAHVLEQPKWSPQRVFVQEVLEKEVRLAYWDKIKESLQSSPEIIELLPPQSKPNYKYGAGQMGEVSEAETSIATELIQMLTTKKTAKDILSHLVDKIIPDQGQKSAINIFVQTIIYIGSKSFTHTVTMLERYGTVLTKLGSSNQDWQIAVIEAVAEFWKFSAQMTAIVIDRMMGYRIISNLAIVAWIFSDENVNRFHTSDHVWEILSNAINKTNNRINDLRKDMVSIQKAATAGTAAVARAQAKLDAAQLMINSAETDEAKAQANAKNEWAKTVMRKAKAEESSALESVEAKEALLARALHEQETLFIFVFRSFGRVVTDRLSKTTMSDEAPSSEMEKVSDSKEDAMIVGEDIQVADDDGADQDAERRNQRGGRPKNNGVLRTDDSKGQEEQQWRKTTLGHLQAISRQYATEVWEVMETIDAEVLTDEVNPLVSQTAFAGLRRPC